MSDTLGGIVVVSCSASISSCLCCGLHELDATCNKRATVLQAYVRRTPKPACVLQGSVDTLQNSAMAEGVIS